MSYITSQRHCSPTPDPTPWSRTSYKNAWIPRGRIGRRQHKQACRGVKQQRKQLLRPKIAPEEDWNELRPLRFQSPKKNQSEGRVFTPNSAPGARLRLYGLTSLSLETPGRRTAVPSSTSCFWSCPMWCANSVHFCRSWKLAESGTALQVPAVKHSHWPLKPNNLGTCWLFIQFWVPNWGA
jgi:hypothetical protein